MHPSTRGFWWSSRPWICRWPGSESPFCALSVAMDLHNCRVNHRVFHIRLVTESIEYPFENIGFNPTSEPLERAVPVSEFGGKITPRCVRPRDPQHSFQKQAIVAPGAAACIGATKAKRCDDRPLMIRQYKAASIHNSLPVQEDESENCRFGNPNCQHALERIVFRLNRSASGFTRLDVNSDPT